MFGVPVEGVNNNELSKGVRCGSARPGISLTVIVCISRRSHILAPSRFEVMWVFFVIVELPKDPPFQKSEKDDGHRVPVSGLPAPISERWRVLH